MTEDRKIIELEEFMEMQQRQMLNMYPRVTGGIRTDPNYCGLGSINTGPKDPWWKLACEPHDQAFNKLIETGEGNDAKIFLQFTGNILDGMAKGLYMLVTGPAYWAIGGIGGLFRWSMVIPRDKIDGDPVDNEDAGT